MKIETITMEPLHIPFRHGFQRRRLGSRGCSIDLVRQQHVREDWPLVKLKSLVALVEYRDLEDIRRQQIRRELNALELERHYFGKRLRERGLTRPRHIIQQHVATARICNHKLFDDFRLRTDDLPDGICNIVHQRTEAFILGTCYLNFFRNCAHPFYLTARAPTRRC